MSLDVCRDCQKIIEYNQWVHLCFRCHMKQIRAENPELWEMLARD